MRRPSIIASCLVVVLVGAVSGRSTTSTSTTTTKESELSTVDHLKMLDKEDRELFMKVHLAKGLNKRAAEIPYADRDTVVELPGALGMTDEKFAEVEELLEVPSDFSENLLDYTRQEFALDYEDVHTLVLHSTVCFPNGSCTDIDDIGSVCCPF